MQKGKKLGVISSNAKGNFDNACCHCATHEDVLRRRHVTRRAYAREIVEETAQSDCVRVASVIDALVSCVDELKAVSFTKGASHAAVFP